MNVEEDSATPEAPGVERNEKLGGKPPLTTLLTLSFGPLISQLAGALYGVINTMWVSKWLGQEAMSAISTATSFDNISRAFGYFTSVGTNQQISNMFGRGREQEATQVLCDMLRVSLICGAIVPAIMLPLEPIVVRWFGTPEVVVDLGYQYISPNFYCAVLTCLFLTVTGALQSEGRTLLVGIVTLCCLLVSSLGLVPLFMMKFGWGMRGAGIATVIAEGIPGIVLIVLYFSGAFTLKPKWGQLLKKFSPETTKAIQVGLSQLVSNLSVSIPGILMRKLLGMSVNGDDEFNKVLSGFNVLFRYSTLTVAIIIAVNSGYLPAASYSVGAKRYDRFIKLSVHLLWIQAVWCFITWGFALLFPKSITKIFSNDENFLEYTSEIMIVGNSGQLIAFIRYITQVVLQSLQCSKRAAIISIVTQLLAVLAAMLVLFYTDKNNPVRLMYCYSISYVVGIFVGLPLVYGPVMEKYRLSKETGPQDLEEIEEEENVQEI